MNYSNNMSCSSWDRILSTILLHEKIVQKFNRSATNEASFNLELSKTIRIFKTQNWNAGKKYIF